MPATNVLDTKSFCFVDLRQAMPELPEIEALRQRLAPSVVGRELLSITILKSRLIRPRIASDLNAALEKALIVGLDRRAKYLLFTLVDRQSRPQTLLLHLGMTGRLSWIANGDFIPKQTGALFFFESQSLVFEDVRQFGRIGICGAELDELGPEPLEAAFTSEVLQTRLAGSGQSIKTLLMDQTRVVGIGNIYASESLFLARISPFRPAKFLQSGEINRLHASIRDTLISAIDRNLRATELGGFPFYYSPNGKAKSVESPPEFNVYGATGRPCLSCGTLIQKRIQLGRSTFFCSACQV
ncbi:MAG: bifunctional DNA-formamidopyrimidine glycosylase/DNA-(apurinic or apyrimidinic site) lyase [Pedosphaera sp.]|nr:bifunctional DNA-formamidopyrimidine glycosylase/DNA-(apurinic or apyrimidinic site) lyase [Pedosphaera sp.]